MPGQKQPTEPVPSPAEAAIGNERPEYPLHRIDREQGIPTVPSFHWINDNGRQRLSRREHRYHLARSPPTRKPKNVLDADQASRVSAGANPPLFDGEDAVFGGGQSRVAFRKSVTGVFGIVTDGFGNVTGHFGDVAKGSASHS